MSVYGRTDFVYGRIDAHRMWLPGSVVARMLGLADRTLPEKASAMGIRVRRLPARKGPLYNREDVERLVSQLEAESQALIESAQK